MLTDFADTNSLCRMNTCFEKYTYRDQQWTLESTNAAKSGHEIDFCLCIDRLMVTNVELLSRLNISSDDRPVRLT